MRFISALNDLAEAAFRERPARRSSVEAVACEDGIPAIANVRGATTLLHDGDRVRLDASAAVVEILGRAGDGG